MAVRQRERAQLQVGIIIIPIYRPPRESRTRDPRTWNPWKLSSQVEITRRCM